MATGLVLALALLAAVQTVRSGHPSTFEYRAKDHHDVSRYDVNRVRISDLQDKLSSMEQKYEASTPKSVNKIKELLELEARINDLEGHDCKSREWKCGTEVLHCVSDLLVCDGYKDCPDNSDETDCENPARPGISLEGDSYNVRCLAELTPTKIHIDIIGEKRLTWFPTVSEVQLHMVTEFQDSHTQESVLNAMYYYGHNQLVVSGREGSTVGMDCKFTTHQSDFCHCTFLNFSTTEICGEAILSVV